MPRIRVSTADGATVMVDAPLCDLAEVEAAVTRLMDRLTTGREQDDSPGPALGFHCERAEQPTYESDLPVYLKGDQP